MKNILTDCNGAARPSVNKILSPGQTVVGDQGYQEHTLFDLLQAEGKSFMIQISKYLINVFMSREAFPSLFMT